MPRHFIAEEGPLQGTIYVFEDKDQWIVGRDPEVSDFVIEDNTVSRKHALCRKEDKGIIIKNLSKTNPVQINDLPLTKEHLLEEGDHVKIGHNTFLYSEEDLPNLEPKVKEEVPSPYDTIFEENEKELPISLEEETPILLKVISGPNAGAEFGMEIGKTYIIGKDPITCDIAFTDMSVSRHHARVMIDANKNIFIEDLGSKNKTLINGREITEKTQVNPQDVIAAGTTVFLIIDKERELETIYSPISPLEFAFPKEAPEEIAEKEEKMLWREVVIPKKYLVIAGSFVVILFSAFISFFSLFKSHRIEVAVKDYSKEIQKILSPYEDVQFSYNPRSESLFLAGHVLTILEHEELTYQIKQLPSIEKIENNIVIDELVWKNINDLLSANEAWRGIYIHSSRPGRFILSGYVEKAEQSEEIMDFLNTNFPFIDRLENQIGIDTLLKTEVASLLIANGFEGITFQLISGDLVLGGRFNAQKEKTYEGVLQMMKKIQGIRSIKNLAIASTPESSGIDLSEKYQVTGYASRDSKNFSVVINGQIISLGEDLDGMKVTSIEPNIILLEKAGLKYMIRYSR